MDKNYPLGIVWSGECFQFDLAFVNYPLLKKKKKKSKIFRVELEGGITLTQRSLTFRGSLELSESCAYRFEPLLAHLSERWDYLNEFEWSVRRVKVENIAVTRPFLTGVSVFK